MRRQGKDKGKIILGVTGSYGSGKSTVCSMLKHYGAEIIDADKLAHRYLAISSKTYPKIIKAFGKGILDKNYAIDRKRLGRIVFKDKGSLRRLNNIVHPEVIRDIQEAIKRSPRKVIAIDAPLLIEAGLDRSVDKIIVVNINKKEQIRRMQKKSASGRAKILKRIKCQIPLQQKIKLADFVIDNSASPQETKRQVGEMLTGLGLRSNL